MNIKDKQKKFIVTEFDQVRNRQPLNSFAVAHLFYGVPFKFNTVYRELSTNNLVFSK
jgi:hypothetical protein